MSNVNKTVTIDIESSGLAPTHRVPGKRPNTTRKEQLPYDTHYMEYPYIVELGWKIDNNESVSFIINQEGRTIPDEAIAIHGITNEMAEKSLYKLDDVIVEFLNSASENKIVIGQNIYFDTSVIKANVLRLIELGRLPEESFVQLEKNLHKSKRIDTLRCSMKLMGGFAKLGDIYEKLFGEQIENAHSAKSDIDATYRIYLKLLEDGLAPTYEQLVEKHQEKAIEAEIVVVEEKKIPEVKEINKEKIEKESTDIVVQAKELVITNEDQYEKAVEFGKTVKKAMKEVEAEVLPNTKKAHEAHTSAKELEKKLLAPFKEAIELVKLAGSKYQAEKRRLEAIEQARVDALAKKAEEEERQRLLDEATEQESDGNKEVAEAMLEQAQDVIFTAPKIASEKSKVQGSSLRKNWKFEITDKTKIPSQYLIIDEKAIGAMVRSQKENCNIPGVRIYSVNSVAF